MKQSRCMSIVACFLFITVFSFCACNASWASPPPEESSDMKVLIDEVRQLRADLQRYSSVSYKVQAYLGKLQVQMVKVNTARDSLATIGAEIENLNSQNATDKEEIDKLTEQVSLEMIDKNDLNLQIMNIRKSITGREKLIGDMRTKEILKEAEFKEEQKKLEVISSDINLLEIELKGR